MSELISGGGSYSWLVLGAVALVWSGALARISAPGRDYRSATAGGWLVLGGVTAASLAAATLVPPHASVLMTVYTGIGPALLAVLGMAGLIIVDGLADWLNPPVPGRRRVVRWGGMTLILSGIGLLMEVRAALAVHMGVVVHTAPEMIEATERWFQLARGAGAVTALIGLALMIDGLTSPWLTAAAAADLDDEDLPPPAQGA